MNIKTKYSIQDIDDWIEMLNKRSNGFTMNPYNKVYFAKRESEKIFLRGYLFHAFGIIDITKNEIYLKVKTHLLFKIVWCFPIIIFILFPLFYENTIIEGNSNASFWERINFVIPVFIALVIVFLVFYGIKKEFEKKIKNKLEEQ